MMVPPVRFALVACAVLLLPSTGHASIVISDFTNFATQLSSMEISWNSAGIDQYTQNSGFITIGPVSGGDPKGDGYFNAYMPGGSLANPAGGDTNITGQTLFSLNARVDSGNASSNVQISLYDAAFTKVASGIFLASSLTSSFSTAFASLNFTGSGDPAHITYWSVNGDNVASDNFRFSFSDLTVTVPEPASVLLLGLGALLFSRRSWRSQVPACQ